MTLQSWQQTQYYITRKLGFFLENLHLLTKENGSFAVKIPWSLQISYHSCEIMVLLYILCHLLVAS